jgi:hypothetical protein
MSEKEDILLTGIENGMIGVVLARMDTHPEEFWGDCEKWRFIYKDYFRDAMTETEKGMIFDKIKKIRREEFNQTVLNTLVPPEEEQDEEYSAFGSAPMKREGSSVNYKFTATDSMMAKQLGMSMTEYAKNKKGLGL